MLLDGADAAKASVRDAVAMALAWVPGDERVVHALTAALMDEDEEVRWSANFALTQLCVDPPLGRPGARRRDDEG